MSMLCTSSVAVGMAVQRQLHHGVDPGNMVDVDDFEKTLCPTPLHQACYDGRFDVVQLMFESKTVSSDFNIDSVNCQGQTPLLLAVQSGNVDLVSYLIDAGSAVHHTDNNDNNALHVAAAAGIRWFVRHRGGMDHGQQMMTADREQREMVDLLISHGVSARHRNRHGLTPVRLAVMLGSNECGRRMLKRLFAESGFSQSIDAVQPEHSRPERCTNHLVDNTATTPSQLKEADADNHHDHLVNSLNRLIFNRSVSCPMLSSASNGVRSTRQRGRNIRSHVVDVSPLLGVSSLYAACAAGDHDAVRILLDICRADPDYGGCSVTMKYGGRADRQGHHLARLPLGVAVLRNDDILVRLLLDHGAAACSCCSSCWKGMQRRTTTSVDRGADDATAFADNRGQNEDEVDVDQNDCDLLELATYTDWSVSRLLIAGGACITPAVERFLSASVRSITVDLLTSSALSSIAEIITSIYEATGDRESVKRILFDPVGPTHANIQQLKTMLRRAGDGGASCDSLLQLSRVTIRQALCPRVFWAVERLPLPDALKRFIVLE